MANVENIEPSPRGAQAGAMCLYIRDMLEQLGNIASDLNEEVLASAIELAVEEARRTVLRKITVRD